MWQEGTFPTFPVAGRSKRVGGMEVKRGKQVRTAGCETRIIRLDCLLEVVLSPTLPQPWLNPR